MQTYKVYQLTGESITDEEFLNYFHQLPRQPPRPNEDTQLTDDDQIQHLLIRHALYRIKYYNEFENDGTLDWYFHPDYCMLAPLDDYQLIVPWYNECVHGMGYDSCRSKELDVYFGIWQQVARLKMSLRDAFVGDCKLNKVPLNQAQIKLLENEDDSSKLKKQYYTFTKGISGEVTDDTALELIAVEVKNKWRRPKFYEHYVRKKMEIAQAIGLIPRYKIDFVDN
uniref:Uncharacterized protein n=1 Tax=Oryza punctata TaxID=4537 RepID=A0A0E0JU08_ORYPU